MTGAVFTTEVTESAEVWGCSGRAIRGLCEGRDRARPAALARRSRTPAVKQDDGLAFASVHVVCLDAVHGFFEGSNLGNHDPGGLQSLRHDLNLLQGNE